MTRKSVKSLKIPAMESSSDGDNQDIKFIATADQTPRYVKLDFQPAKTQKENLQDALSHSGLTISESNLLESFDKEDFFMGSFQDISENVKIEDIIENNRGRSFQLQFFRCRNYRYFC